MYGLVCFCTFEQKARADSFHEKEVVLDKPELGVRPNHERSMARDLEVERVFAHLVFEPESFCSSQAGLQFMIALARKCRVMGMCQDTELFL